jgi:hypothetical protein
LIKIDQSRFDLGETVRLYDDEEPRALTKEVCVVRNRWWRRDSFVYELRGGPYEEVWLGEVVVLAHSGNDMEAVQPRFSVGGDLRIGREVLTDEGELWLVDGNGRDQLILVYEEEGWSVNVFEVSNCW